MLEHFSRRRIFIAHVGLMATQAILAAQHASDQEGRSAAAPDEASDNPAPASKAKSRQVLRREVRRAGRP